MLDIDQDQTRLLALQIYDVMDTAPEPAFDRITAVAARIAKAPVALITFISDTRQWIKSGFGTTLKNTPPSLSLCSYTIKQSEGLLVLDTHQDPRFATNPLVCGSPPIRFYCGVPILTPEGVPVGALCVIDHLPREHFSAPELAGLYDLSGIITDLLDHRRRILLGSRAILTVTVKDSILSHITESPSGGSFVGAIMRELGAAYGATCGELWTRASLGRTLRQIDLTGSLTAGRDLSGFLLQELKDRDAVETLIAAALDADHPLSLEFTPAFSSAALSLLAVSVSVGKEDYAIVLGFSCQATHLKTVMYDVGLLIETLEPIIKHRNEQDELFLLRSALAATTEGVLITLNNPTERNTDHVVYVNESLCRAVGYGEVEIVGRSTDFLYDDKANATDLRRLRATLAAGNAASALLILRRKDGTRLSAEVDAAPIVDGNGGDHHFVSVLRDVTAKLASERERRRFDRAFEVMFEANPLPMFVFDAQTSQFIMVNEAAITFYGWSRDEFMGLTMHDIQTLGERVDPRCLDGTRTMSERGIWAHRRSDGSNVKLGGVAQKHPAGGRQAVLAVVWDITEVEAARRELKGNYERMEYLAAQLKALTQELINANKLARLGLWRLSPDRRTMTWSDEIYELLGRKRQELAPSLRHFLDVVHPEDRSLLRRLVLMTDHVSESRQVELRILRPDGRVRHLRLELCPSQPGSDRGGWHGYAQDISDHWETQQVLMRSEKLAILGHLTGGIAHDFNNLLTVVTLNLEEVIADLPETDEAHPILVAALQAAQRCSDLTSHLLAYARQAPLRPKATSFATLFKTWGPLVRHALGNTCKLRMIVDDEDCTPLVDVSQLRTALLNIVLNAREAMPEGGEVLVKAAAVRLPSAEFQIEAPAGSYAMISVSDEGHGIEPEVLPRIFEPFFTTKGAASSGLGLSMVDGFIGQSGGQTLVRSNVGEGTTITLFLPIATHQRLAASNVHTRGVLLVEDQAAVLATVSRMFTQLGYRVTAVDSAAAALSILDAGADFDVMLTDIRLPGDIDGIDLARLVAQRAPSIRVLLTSGFTDHDLSRLDLPQVDILMKPYKRDDLLQRLNSVISQPENLTRN